MAPLTATVAATLALGIGVALARSGRDRRSARDLRLERQFALLGEEPLGVGLRRIALGQVDRTLELLEGGGPPGDKAVHETRKALKRLRALIGLLEGALPDKRRRREEAALRDIGRRLSGARDAEVMLATFEGLLAEYPRKLGEAAGVGRLRRHLREERERMKRRTLGDPATLAQVLGELRAFRSRVGAWELTDRDGLALVQPGLLRIYKHGRRRYRRVAAGRGERVRSMHEWRKRVKDLRYAAELLQRSDGAVKGAHRQRGTREQARRYLRRLARRADELGELLGEEHDLAMLAGWIRAGKSKRGRGRPRLPRRTRKRLLKLIERRRRELHRRALAQGERLYRPSSKRFTRELRRSVGRDAGLS